MTEKEKGREPMQLVTYLNFDGDCREAFTFYQQVLGGEIVAMIDHSQMPMEVEPGWRDRILHARLVVDGQVLMGSDVPPGAYEAPRSMLVSVQVDSIAEAERIFPALTEGGTVEMPLAQQPWATRFGSGTDKFGIPWMVNCEQASD